MKTRLNVISNNKTNNFLNNLLPKFELIFLRFDNIDYNEQNRQANIIIANNKDDLEFINFSKLSKNYLIISNLKNNNKTILDNNLHFLRLPITIDNFKNKIDNFVQNLIVQFCDVSLDNEKLINHKSNAFCYLTKVEIEILTYLIREKETSKNFIKENILNIKSNIETNSLESHLTRIRKKMNKIKSAVKIKTRNEKLLITN